MKKQTPEELAAHYERQQSDLIKLDRLFKKRKPQTLAEWQAITLERSQPYPLALVWHVWNINQ